MSNRAAAPIFRTGVRQRGEMSKNHRGLCARSTVMRHAFRGKSDCNALDIGAKRVADESDLLGHVLLHEKSGPVGTGRPGTLPEDQRSVAAVCWIDFQFSAAFAIVPSLSFRKAW